jgi:uncharacterized repeat protein (TIGR03803 family)
LLTPHIAAQTSFTTLYKFGAPPDGQSPNGVASGANGALYGTTQAGGAYNAGTVFELQPPKESGGAWTETVLHSFPSQNGVDGTTPFATPVVGPNGGLYGTTLGGGTFDQGSVFELRPPAAPGGTWTEAVLYSFTNQNGDGSEPYASLVIGRDGAFYGTTFYGSGQNYGTVFELQPPVMGGAWTERVLYSFAGQPDGGFVEGLTMGPGGVLYATTLNGGVLQAGTTFALAPPVAPDGTWTAVVLHSFTGGTDGCYPVAAPVVTSDGIYGSTTGTIDPGGYPGVMGMNTVFELTPPGAGSLPAGGNWNKTLLAAFGYGNLLATATSLIVRDGTIYGVAATRSGGEVFELRQPAAGGQWTKIVLHTFTDGNTPTGTLVVDESGAIYGVTVDLLRNPAGGTVYRIRP